MKIRETKNKDFFLILPANLEGASKMQIEEILEGWAMFTETWI